MLLLMTAGVLLSAQSPQQQEQPAQGQPSQDAAAPQTQAPAGDGQATQTSAAGLALPSGADVAVIRIEGMIYDFTLESLKRRVERAKEAGASVIVLELHTPGGIVTSALDISKYLKNLNSEGIYTIAWINSQAYSAGIMIASACDQIVMAPSSAVGDCAPIVPGQDMAPTERAKALSPILEEFRDNATNNGYDFALFHAMCVLGVEVYYVENEETGERRLVNQVDYEIMVRGNSGTGVASHAWSGYARPNVDDDIGQAAREVARDEDQGKWVPVEKLPSGAFLPEGRVHDGRTLLTLNQTRAQDLGLSRATIGSDVQLRQYLGAKTVQHVAPSWSENLAGFLTHPMVRAVLLLLLLGGAYLESQSPGLIVPGAIALLALIALLGAPFVVGLAEVWHIIVFFIGFVLLIIEVAFTPSFGILGVVGLIMMFMGLVLSVVPTVSGAGGFRLPPAVMWNRLLASMLYMTLGLIASMVAFFFITKHFGRIPGLNRLMLPEAQVALTTGEVARPYERVSGDETIGGGGVQVGAVGRVATTGLRPSGQAEIAGQLVDVVSDGVYIEPGTRIVVREVHGNRIVVDKA